MYLTYQMKMMARLTHTEKLAIHPNRCRVRICPRTKPAAVKISRQATKHMPLPLDWLFPCEICDIDCPLLKMSAATDRSSCVASMMLRMILGILP